MGNEGRARTKKRIDDDASLTIPRRIGVARVDVAVRKLKKCWPFSKGPDGIQIREDGHHHATGNTDEPVFKATEMAIGDYEFNLDVAD